jgi:hypothetical protein
LTSYKLDCENALVELASIRDILGLNGLIHGSKLHKGVVSLHIDSDQFSKRLKEHL